MCRHFVRLFLVEQHQKMQDECVGLWIVEAGVRCASWNPFTINVISIHGLLVVYTPLRESKV